jgi:hypothetical protein
MTDDVDTDLLQIRERLACRLSELDEQLVPLQVERARLHAQLELVERALSVNGTGAPAKPVPEMAATEPVAAGPRETVPAVVANILAEAGVPLHISEIRNRYVASGHAIPGRGTESNLLIYMGRNPRFVRVTKGTYALSDGTSTIAQAQESTLTKVRKRRRRRRSR